MNKQTKNLLWEAGWYELDQSIKVGKTQELLLWKGKNKLYNCLLKEGDYEKIKGTIVSINHPVLGSLSEINTEGLDYAFILSNGKQLIVNAEERPGEFAEGQRFPVKYWKFKVVVGL
jgi:hypothetical protein